MLSNNLRYIDRTMIKRSALDARESPTSKVEVASILNIVRTVFATANWWVDGQG